MEFQAVVMAGGKGSRMTDLTSKCYKAVLPIGNRPMIWYSLNSLERAGFEDVIIIALESSVNEIHRSLSNCNIKIKLDVVPIPDNEDWGTAESLRYIRDKIKTDVLVMSCDLISDLSLHHIANLHQAYDSSATMLLSTLPDQFIDIPAPGIKSKKKTVERDFIGFDENGKRVLFLTSEADLEDTISFQKSTLKRHPFINIRSKLTDCHLYLFKKWVIDFLAQNQKICTIKGELIPYLVRRQFRRPKLPDTDLPGNVSLTQTDTKPDIHDFTSEDSNNSKILELTTWTDHEGDMADCFHGESVRCYAHIQDDGFCIRANTLGTYIEANRQIPKILSTLSSNKNTSIKSVHPSAIIKEKSQIGSDCIVGEDVQIGEKVSIKRSIIGKNCVIGDKVKLTGSLIMDNARIDESCNIQGSIICSKASLSEKCELKDCIVGHTQTIIAMGKFTNEAIIDVDKMMEI
ncbi:hypothetical protein LOTGIDRAFT_206598 [Lottia gigantea]|uniref:Translation initiation factor eIF2B subunit gamma n=1 Tax=Lottia gigantea TaxID=225164 RepID=V3ZLT4_LOTGI|nr:hypothetical protein LOTGIDRAFT_206598 [Lottia gigantea]ESO92323.1 hypothetical protein LOTGIDRAFT_206598 [Lottia gigantea]